ncbi:hypothetical protein JXA47_14885 [Candidatus Sumerlaeota bacterium]|nr:hypothetical protein [Candidatus Sumerlaeota bacterium]
MKFLAFVLILVGVGYAWFMFYEPTPSSGTMQGTMHQFQQALMNHDAAAMRALCTETATDDCDAIVERLRNAEDRFHTSLSSVGSIGFDYTRQRSRVEGLVMGMDDDGEELINLTVAVEQQGEGGDWKIVVIR